MSTIDFNKPATTDLYTAWPTSIQANQQSLGFLLDPTYVTAYSNLVTGMYRFSTSSKVFEQWSGSVWGAVDTGYVKDTGDTMTGPLIMSNNTALQWKDSGGTARSIANVNASNLIVFGDIGNAIAGSIVHVGANSSLSLDINGSVAATLSSTAFTLASGLKFIGTQAESIRITNDGGYMAFYNTANSVRSGFVQGNASGGFIVAAENGNALQFYTGGGAKVIIDTSGNVVMQPSTSVLAHNSTTGNLIVVANATLVDGTARIELYDTAHASLAKQVAYRADTHTWTKAAASTAEMTLTSAGSLVVGSSLTSVYDFSGRAVIQASGATSALLGLAIGGTAVGYLYHDGSALHLHNAGGSLNFAAGGTDRFAIGAGGASTFTGSAATTRYAIGSQATLTVDWSKSNYQTMTLTANVAAGGWIFTNAQDGQTLTLKITQDATGGRTIAANSAVKWPGGTLGILSTAPNAVDLMCLTYDAATGFYYATLAKGFA